MKWKLLEENDHNLAKATFNGKEQGEELFSRSDSLGHKRKKERSKRWNNIKRKRNTNGVADIKEDDGPYLLLKQSLKEG